MNTLFRGISIVTLVAVSVSACGMFKKKGEDDAGPDDAQAADAADEAAAAATPATTAPPVAANVDDIARFPDETKIDNTAATIQRPTNVREVPQSGKVVAALSKGGAVVQIAQRKEFFLVVFDNPKDATKKLMGWVPADSFTAAAVADAGIKAITCGVGETALVGDAPFCGKVCASDNDCPAGQACKGASNKLVNGKAAEAVTVCTVFVAPDAGAKPGVIKPGVGVTDAAAPTPAAPTGDVVAPPCPVEFALVQKDGKCHRRCPKVDACKTDKFCVKCGGVAVCAASQTFCK